MKRPPSPKRSGRNYGFRSDWYAYYAGYDELFASEVVAALSRESATILDPWNGGGTTTEIAHLTGRRGIGFDINPVMVLVAKARLLRSNVSSSETALAARISRLSASRPEVARDHPLCRWLVPSSASVVNGIASAIDDLLIGHSVNEAIDEIGTRVSSLAAFFYVALFRTVRQVLGPFRASNPTWISVNVPKAGRLRPRRDRLIAQFEREVAAMSSLQFRGTSAELGVVSVHVGDSTKLPIPASSVDLILTSPPYATRIDYAIATLPELAVLGVSDAEIRTLRETMIGSAVVRRGDIQSSDAWGPACVTCLDAIGTHDSYAAKSYYHRNLIQYFSGLHASIVELDRVMRRGGNAVLVVQDSFFKDVHIDLAQIVREMGEALGWMFSSRHDYAAVRNLGRINPKAIQKRHAAIESVVHFRKN